MSKRTRMEKRVDGWLVILDEGGREVARVKPPDGGFTEDDLNQFMAHLRRNMHGPS